MDLMAGQHGVASTRQSRALGRDPAGRAAAARRRRAAGAVPRRAPVAGAPTTFHAPGHGRGPGARGRRRLPRRRRPAARARRLRASRRRRRDRRPRRQPAAGAWASSSTAPGATSPSTSSCVDVDPGAVDRRHAGPARPGRRRPGHGPGARQRHPPRRRPRRPARAAEAWRRRGRAGPDALLDAPRPPRRRRPNRGRSRFFGVSLPLSGSRKRQKPDAAGVTGAQPGGRRWSSNRCTDHGSPSLKSRRVRPRSSPSTANDTALSCESMSS